MINTYNINIQPLLIKDNEIVTDPLPDTLSTILCNIGNGDGEDIGNNLIGLTAQFNMLSIADDESFKYAIYWLKRAGYEGLKLRYVMSNDTREIASFGICDVQFGNGKRNEMNHYVRDWSTKEYGKAYVDLALPNDVPQPGTDAYRAYVETIAEINDHLLQNGLEQLRFDTLAMRIRPATIVVA